MDGNGPEWKECAMYVLNKLGDMDEKMDKILENQAERNIDIALIKSQAKSSGRISGGVASAIVMGAVKFLEYLTTLRS